MLSHSLVRRAPDGLLKSVSAPRYVVRVSDSHTEEEEHMTQKAPDPSPALTPPPGTDRSWQEKIARAKAASEHGKSLRAGKPASFRLAVGRSR